MKSKVKVNKDALIIAMAAKRAKIVSEHAKAVEKYDAEMAKLRLATS